MERHEASETGTGGEGFSRRGLLTGAMLGAAAAMLAGCQGDDDDDD